MNLTATEITSAAIDFNAEYPEAAAEIQAGTPKVRVYLESADNYGRKIRAVIRPGIEVDGAWIDAGEPEVKSLRRFDGRLTRTEIARRASRFLGLTGAQVEIDYREVGC